jgi:hypothetical protein
MHEIKKPNAAAAPEELPGLLTLNKLRSRERGRFTQPMLLPRGLATPYTSPVRGAASLDASFWKRAVERQLGIPLQRALLFKDSVHR